ncbi:MAG: PilZ domain-containing protein, partial [Planctomycetes bacterium]|nr:PilZ domain-containing protein [Planctomycetota bacterium]
MSLPQHERRQHPRAQAEELPLRIGDQAESALRVRDLSQSGVAFFCDEAIPMMTAVKVAIEMPSGDLIQAEGVVVRCERLSPAIGHYEIAIFFQSLN